MEKDSLGLIEVLGLVGAIEAADAGSKAANVTFRGYQRGLAGLITVFFTGDVAAVRAAISAGVAAAKRVGQVVSMDVIARPDNQLHVTRNGTKPVPQAASSRRAVSADGAAGFRKRRQGRSLRDTSDRPQTIEPTIRSSFREGRNARDAGAVFWFAIDRYALIRARPRPDWTAA